MEPQIGQHSIWDIGIATIKMRTAAFSSTESCWHQQRLAHLAFIWLFLAAASLAVMGSGRAEGRGEFWEEKHSFQFKL